MVKGAIEQNIDTLGHSNDFTYLNGKYYGAWYQENGKEDYSNKIGEIGAKLKNNGVVGKLDNGTERQFLEYQFTTRKMMYLRWELGKKIR